MRNHLQRGYSNAIGILILAIVLIIISSTPRNSSPTKSTSSGGGLYGALSAPTSFLSHDSSLGTSGSFNTSLSGSVTVNSGNAPYTYQPFEEYITIDNNSQSNVDITSWQLRNGKDHRTTYSAGTLQRFSADIASIPQAANLLSPSGFSNMTDVVLKPGERAVVTTGGVGVTSPYRITSFKENMCTGYIEALPDYAFFPPLSQNCPRPAYEPGVENLDTQCRDFLKTFSSCRTPTFDARTSDGASCSTCVDGKILSSQCYAFIKEHFSYQGCVANHSSDPNFYGRTWRVFLGRSWEMWNKDYESIELYNRNGELQSYVNY